MILPVLLLIVLLVLDFGHLFLGWVNLQNTARIGADFAATHPEAWSSTSSPALDARARYEALINADATTINCDLPSSIPTPNFPDGTTTLNGRAEVRLTCDFRILTPIIGAVIGDPLVLGASAIFPIRAGLEANVPLPTASPTPTPTAPPTPTPTPSESPSSSPTPTPTPVPCIVPDMMGRQPNAGLQQQWTNAGFAIPFNVTVGTTKVGHEYVIDPDGTQHPGNYDGMQLPCEVAFLVAD